MQKILDQIDLHVVVMGVITLIVCLFAFPLITLIQVLITIPGIFTAGLLLMAIALAPPILTRFSDHRKHHKDYASAYLIMNAAIATFFAVFNGAVLMAALWLFA